MIPELRSSGRESAAQTGEAAVKCSTAAPLRGSSSNTSARTLLPHSTKLCGTFIMFAGLSLLQHADHEVQPELYPAALHVHNAAAAAVAVDVPS